MSDIYYRIQFDGVKINICELQIFDENGYDKRKWLTEKKFNSEEDVIKFLREKKDLPGLDTTIKAAINNYLSKNPSCWTNCLDNLKEEKPNDKI